MTDQNAEAMTARKPSRGASQGEAAGQTSTNVAPAPTTLVKPVDNAIKILRYLSVIRAPSTVTLIARELKINPSTCFNILRTLVWNGVIDFDPNTKSYKTGLGAIDLANRALLNSADGAEQKQALLEKIAETYGVTAMVWRRIGEDRMMLVSIADSNAAVRIHLRQGQRFPLLIGASGRVMAAFGGIEEAEIRRRFPGLKWNRPVTVEDYLKQIEKTRKTGWAIDDGNFVAGMVTVAVPIYNEANTLRGVVSAAMFRGQHDKATIKKIVDELKAYSTALTTGQWQSAT